MAAEEEGGTAIQHAIDAIAAEEFKAKVRQGEGVNACTHHI